MLEVPVYNPAGEKVDTLEVDETVFGGQVNIALLKQAIVAYQTNHRQGSAANRGRSQKEGSGRKLFRQKGTGSARRGNLRTNLLRGGGVTFAKTPHAPRKVLPRKMRKAALNSAILAKILGQDLLVVDGLTVEAPKTKVMATLLDKLDIRRSCLLALADRDQNVYLSGRNLPDLTIRITDELNAHDVATRQKMLVTAGAMKSLMAREATA